jgi:hypothetical protein
MYAYSGRIRTRVVYSVLRDSSGRFLDQFWDRCYDFKNIFAEKNAKKLAFLTQNKAKLCKFLIITLDFEKNAIFFAENWQKSQKIVITTSNPDIKSNERL